MKEAQKILPSDTEISLKLASAQFQYLPASEKVDKDILDCLEKQNNAEAIILKGKLLHR